MLALFRLGQQPELDRQRVRRLRIVDKAPGGRDVFFRKRLSYPGRKGLIMYFLRPQPQHVRGTADQVRGPGKVRGGDQGVTRARGTGVLGRRGGVEPVAELEALVPEQ